MKQSVSSIIIKKRLCANKNIVKNIEIDVNGLVQSIQERFKKDDTMIPQAIISRECHINLH